MKLLSSYLTILLLMLAAGCGKKADSGKAGSNNAFSAYIQGHTSGMIGSGDFIQVLLINPVEGYQAGEEFKEKLFEFSPTIKGKTFLVANSIVEFRPDKPLKNGTRFSAEFKLGKLANPSLKPGLFTFQFEVVALDFSVSMGSMIFGAYNKDNLLKYEGRILCSDRMNPMDVAKMFQVQGSQKRIPVSVEQINATTFQYRLDSIDRLDRSYSINLQWDGGNLKLRESGGYEIEVPGKNEFKVLSVKVEQGEEQYIRIDFSDPVDPFQSLQGLVNLDESEDLRISRVNNAVYVYPKIRLTGEKQLRIETGIRSVNGSVLKSAGSFNLIMDALAPKVEFVGNGSLIPDSKGLFLPFRAVSLRAVDVIVYKIFANNIPQFFQFNTLNSSNYVKNVGRPVYRKTVRLDLNTEIDLQQWNVFSIDLTPLVKRDPKALYKVEIRFRLPFALSGCSDEQSADITSYFLPESFDEEYLAGWNSDVYYYENYYPDGYNWQKRDNPCDVSYYTPERFVSKNVLATNLGILVKSYDHRKYTLVVTNLLTATPMAAAKVKLFNFQQQLLGEGTANTDGIAEVMADDVPYLVEATADNQTGYLRVDDGSSLSTSSFDVAGDEVKKGIKGFIYGEREVWRPGDTLFMTFILSDKDRLLPADQPVVMELFNSKGQLVSKQVKTSGNNGFYCFPTPTNSDDPTGNWQAIVQVGGTRFEKQLKVEMIKPNRLKISIDFTNSPLLSNRPGQKAMFRSAWLHGATAGNLRAEVKVRFTKRPNVFNGYANYLFDDPVKVFNSYEETAFNGYLDSDGYADFPINFQANTNAPGMLNAIFNSRVFEQGGDFSADMIAVPFSPFDRYVGISVSGAAEPRQILETGKNIPVNVVVLNPEGVPVTANRLIARVYKIEWRWWWGASDENLASYIGRKDASVVQETVLSAPDGKGSFTIRVDEPDWGRYLVMVSDPEKGHSTGQIIYIDWPSSADRSGRENPSGAAILSFSADKKVYHPGEKAQITFPGMENSRALLTVESGIRVLESRWVEAQKGETRISLDITSNMTPNVYVYLTLIQPHASSSNDMPIRMYGVIPLMVEDPDSRLTPKINLPTEIRPEQDYSVEVSEQNGKPMTYTLAVVDEGLLNLTRFKTPDPWNFFNRKEALGVKTWDNFSDVLGAYGGRLESVLAIGGDGSLVNPSDQKANRFKPVISFIGPFDLKKGGQNRHTLKMLNYVGSVRAMVVAGNNSAWGSAEASAPVKKPLMVLATLPRILSFGEQVDVPVSIFTLDDKIKNVEVKISVGGSLELTGSSKSSLAIPKVGEVMTTFTLKATDRPGVAKIRVDVSSGQETAFHEIEIEIHNPNPTISRMARFVIEPGKEEKLIPVFEGAAGMVQSFVEVATLPSFDLEKHFNYLISYPYGCVEQTTSSAFAQLYLGQLTELPDKEVQKIEKNIAAAILSLSKFQLPDGSLAFWPGSRTTSSWGTTYAMHFLLLAEQKGYLLPSGFKKKLINYQSKTSSAPATSGAYQSDYELQQAYRLFTLALAGQPNLSAMNRMVERPIPDVSASWMLASAYCQIGRCQVAEKLVLNLKPIPANTYTFPGTTFGSNLRDQAIVLNALTLMGRDYAAFDLVEKIAKEMQESELSTQTAAYCLQAIAEFAGKRKNPGNLHFSFSNGLAKTDVNSKKAAYRIVLSSSDEKGAVRVVNTGSDKLYATVTSIGQPPIGQEENSYSNLKMTVEYLDLNHNPLSVSMIKQGTDLKAKVTVVNPGTYGHYENMALSQVFPSGWEIINFRVTDQQSFVVESPYEY
ncbi:MAG: MG2 domain-containing protein, partial [Bacteroidia bacterium]|nr:MG2 domain-containing protein [Bacteroidia bacterium]